MTHDQATEDWIDAERRTHDMREAALIRARETYDRLRATVEAISIHLGDGTPSTDARQALVQTSVRLSELLAVVEAMDRLEGRR